MFLAGSCVYRVLYRGYLDVKDAQIHRNYKTDLVCKKPSPQHPDVMVLSVNSKNSTRTANRQRIESFDSFIKKSLEVLS